MNRQAIKNEGGVKVLDQAIENHPSQASRFRELLQILQVSY